MRLEMSVPKIKLSAEQIRSLLMDGECSMAGAMYEVSSLGLFVRFDECGVLRVVDAPMKRKVGRPKTKNVFIRQKGDSGIFVEKVGAFVVGDDVASDDGRKVRITRVAVKIGRDVSDKEWHLMGCNWAWDKYADSSKELHLSSLGAVLGDEIGLYWFERVE